MERHMITIKYNGSSPFNDWNPGDRRDVDPKEAIELLKNADFSDARHYKLRGKPIAVEADPAPKKVEQEDFDVELPPLMHLDSMTKEQIGVFAKRNFGIDLVGNKPEMIGRVQHLMGHAMRYAR
jgi:hypothetical protein